MRKQIHTAVRAMVIPLVLLTLAGSGGDPVAASSDVAPPPAADAAGGRPVTGRLANGVRFAILSRQGHEPGVAVLMRNEGGFIAEHRPGERGLTHLIEHIAFRSPTVGSPDELEHMKRIGMPLTLPAPNAGSTSWRETNYYLSTKTSAPGDLDALIGLFSEVASGMTLRADAVDASRVEVVREMADKRLGNDVYARYIRAVAPGSPNDRIDAQNSDDVPTASVDAIRGLYRRLYRPETMMIVVVGNVKADAVQALIARRFGDWRRTDPAPRRSPFPVFRRDRISPYSVSALPEGRRAALMTVVMPTPAPASSRDSQLRAEVMDLLVMRAVGDRLAALQPDSPPGKVGMFIENGEQGHRQIMLWDNYAGDAWRPAVAGLRRTTCALVTSGFTQAEWAAAGRNLVADLAGRTAAVANMDMAKDLSHALADGRDFIPPEELLRYARAMLPATDARSASRWWRAQWGSGVEHLRVEGPGLAGVADPLSAVRAAARQADGTAGCTLPRSAMNG